MISSSDAHPPKVGETIWLYEADGSTLFDSRPFRVVRVGPQYDHGLAIELHAGPVDRCAVGHAELTCFWDAEFYGRSTSLICVRESKAQLPLFDLEAAP